MMDYAKLLPGLMLCVLPCIAFFGILVLLLIPTRIKGAARLIDNLQSGGYRKNGRQTRRLLFLIIVSAILLLVLCLAIFVGLINMLYPSLFTASVKAALRSLVAPTSIIVVIVMLILAVLFNKILSA